MTAETSVQQHFVTFFSPGTFVAEMSTKPIEAWDTDAAVAMAHEITERHGATPYGFRFITRGRSDAELDSKEIARSPMYYLGGRVETLAEVEARNDPGERILLSNMRGNGYDRIIVNDNSWRWTQPLNPEDVVLPFQPTRPAHD
jgi:hypothetical protein